MSFFRYKSKLFPLVAIVAGLFVVIFGLVTADSLLACSIYLAGVFMWLSLFGCGRACLRTLPAFIVVGGIFFAVFYAATGTFDAGWAMANRFGAVFLGVVPGVCCEPVRMTRSLSQVHTPRSVTLGMLIAMSFVPMLRGEIRRVREAMKTRGAGSILNPRILYRAFLVPLVMRLVNISDTLALSVETRGFALGKVPYTIYKKESFALSDVLFAAGLVAGAVLTVIL